MGEPIMPRRRYVWDNDKQEMVEVAPDWTGAERRAPVPSEEGIYSNLRATDGTPLNSKRRHAAYLKANGLELTRHMKGEHERWAKEQAARADGTHPKVREERKRQLYETFNQLKNRR